MYCLHLPRDRLSVPIHTCHSPNKLLPVDLTALVPFELRAIRTEGHSD